MATAAHIIMAPVAATPVLTLVACQLAPTGWDDNADVRAIAGMINTCQSMTVALDTIASSNPALRHANLTGEKLGCFHASRQLATTARQWFAVQEPSDSDTVLGALWDELDGARSAWIKARLADDGLADVWSRTDATHAECARAHDLECELSDSAPTVADVVSTAKSFH